LKAIMACFISSQKRINRLLQLNLDRLVDHHPKKQGHATWRRRTDAFLCGSSQQRAPAHLLH
jgi:hypothetical protein